MHEFGIVTGILELVLETAVANGLQRVTRVTIRAGEMRQLVPEMLQFAFGIAAQETVANGATLEVEWVPVEVCCRSCGARGAPPQDRFVCGACGHPAVDVVAGKELELLTLEGDDGIQGDEEHPGGQPGQGAGGAGAAGAQAGADAEPDRLAGVRQDHHP